MELEILNGKRPPSRVSGSAQQAYRAAPVAPGDEQEPKTEKTQE